MAANGHQQKATWWIFAVLALWASVPRGLEAASPATGPSESVPIVTVKVVAGGESHTPATACRGVIVGPGVNQPDPFAGYRGFVGWESPIRLRDGTWAVSFNAGYWHGSPPTPLRATPGVIDEHKRLGMPTDVDAPTGGRAMITRSRDQGRTWSKPVTLLDTPADDRHPFMLELADGTLICGLFTLPGLGDVRKDPSLAYRTIVVRSTDGGRTWDRSSPLPSPFIADESDGPMFLGSDGKAYLTISGVPREPGPEQAAILRSADKGKSWEVAGVVKSPRDLMEAACTQLTDGRLIMVARPDGDIAWSSDLGKTWTPPVTFGMRLFAPSLYVLKDGTLVCLHGSYGAGGLRVIFSRDGGATWVAPHTAHGFLVDNSYGYGKAMLLDDDSLFISYLSTGGHATAQAASNAIWCVRLRISEDRMGIELGPPASPSE